MPRPIPSTLSTLCFLLCAVLCPTLAGSETTNERVPLDRSIFVPCALDGVGEVVVLGGTLHMLTHVTLDEAGGFHMVVNINPQGVGGEGMTSGDRYRGTGKTGDVSLSAAGQGLPFVTTFVNNFRIVGESTGNDLIVRERMHLTVNAQGRASAFVDDVTLDCR